MGLGKKSIKLVASILNDESKRKLYSKEEIAYMQRRLALMKVERARRKLQRKKDQGFGY